MQAKIRAEEAKKEVERKAAKEVAEKEAADRKAAEQKLAEEKPMIERASVAGNLATSNAQAGGELYSIKYIIFFYVPVIDLFNHIEECDLTFCCVYLY